MSFLYSGSTNQFYDQNKLASYPSIPSDAIPVTDSDYTEVLMAISAPGTNCITGPDVIGYPQAYPSNSTQAWIWTTFFQGKARTYLMQSDVTMLRIAEAIALGLNNETSADVAAWATYRKQLRAIMAESTGVPNATRVNKPAYAAGT